MNKPQFDLKKIEIDLVRLFFVGKPLIDTPSSIRMPFRFRLRESEK